MEAGASVEIYSKIPCRYCTSAKSLLEDYGIDYVEYVVTNDQDRMAEMVDRSGGQQTAPQIFIDNEHVGGFEELQSLHAAGRLADMLGIQQQDVEGHRDLIIIGSGIAGLTAAIYGARANNEPLVLEGTEPGGQLTLTSDVANYPGFPDGISGPELIQRMKEQAKRFGAEIRNGIVEDLDASDRPFVVTLRNGDRYSADAVIAASGASARTLGIPGENELMGYGLSTCATCDGAFFRGEEMLVVGGGDAAMEEANFLTKFASKVVIVHRREEFRAEQYWIDRTMERVESGEIELLLNSEVVELHGSREEGVSHVSLIRHPEGHPTERLDDPDTERFEREVGAVFFAIGHIPNTEYLVDTNVEMDDEGYLSTIGGRGAGQTETDESGLFGAGDVVDFHYQQAITAAAMGCEAAMDADDYLENLETRSTESTAQPVLTDADT